METKIIKIDKEELISTIEEALKATCDHGWSGWGVALLLHNNMEITISHIISNSTWFESEDFEEILRIETWSVNYDIQRWANEVRQNQYTENDKKILAEIKNLEAKDEFEIDNLSQLAKEDYERCYEIQMEEDISIMCNHYIEKLENMDRQYGEIDYEIE